MVVLDDWSFIWWFCGCIRWLIGFINGYIILLINWFYDYVGDELVVYGHITDSLVLCFLFDDELVLYGYITD